MNKAEEVELHKRMDALGEKLGLMWYVVLSTPDSGRMYQSRRLFSETAEPNDRSLRLISAVEAMLWGALVALDDEGRIPQPQQRI
jgi:hypothetical protein